MSKLLKDQSKIFKQLCQEGLIFQSVMHCAHLRDQNLEADQADTT